MALAGGGAVEVLHWAWSPDLPDNVWHRHAYFEACLVGESGVGEFLVGGDRHALLPGTLFLARPGALHRIENAQAPGMELFWVSFALEKLGEGVVRRFAESEVVWVAAPRAVSSLWQSLRTVASDPTAEPETVHLTAALLTAIARACGGTAESLPLESDTAQQALAYIHEHLAQRELSVALVAHALAISPRHLTRRITERVGVGPAAYIERARLDRARTLLLRTDEPLKQLALLVGYPDVHHFTRAFSRVFGCPPGRFRATKGAASQRELVANRQNEGTLV